VANVAHHTDVGGQAPASLCVSTEIFQEGVIIPPVKVVENEKIVEPILNFFLANVRAPKQTAGDVRAQIAANITAIRRVHDLLRRYGPAPTARKADRPVYFAETQGAKACAIYDRYALRAGNVLRDPAIVEEVDSTTVILNLFRLLLGCLIEGIPLMLILSPILFQIAKQVGVDPVHFGVLFTVNVMVGMVTPPIGLNLFVVSAISRAPVWEIAPAAVPFMLLMTAALMVITSYPPMTLWLPNLLLGT
jgi:hypothetical protein